MPNYRISTQVTLQIIFDVQAPSKRDAQKLLHQYVKQTQGQCSTESKQIQRQSTIYAKHTYPK